PSTSHVCRLVFFGSHGDHRDLHSFPTRRSSDLMRYILEVSAMKPFFLTVTSRFTISPSLRISSFEGTPWQTTLLMELLRANLKRSEEHTSELQSRENLVCRLLLEKKNNTDNEPR